MSIAHPSTIDPDPPTTIDPPTGEIPRSASMPIATLPTRVSPSSAIPVGDADPRADVESGARRWGWLGAYFGAWAAIATMYAVILSIASLTKPNWAFEVVHVVVYTAGSWSVRALVLLPGVWLARRVPFTARGWPLALAVHLPAALVLGTVKSAGSVGFSWLVPMLEDSQFRGYLIGDLPFNVLSYGCVVAAVHGWTYYGRFRERERAAADLAVRASRLEAQLARAELDALKMQLHPHFLFNTLHSISALIHADPEGADLMVSRLSDFLRMVLDHAGAQELPLRDELAFLERYLEIQRTRYRERLDADVEIDPETLDARVPTLILQPLVENAIRHAVEPRAAGGRVRVTARRENGTLRLAVRDDGPGLRDAPRSGNGVGLANTRARLAQLYGGAHAFELRNHPEGGLEVSLALPFRADGAAEEAR
jgi:two-component system, LytTR family, sensor kinase